MLTQSSVLGTGTSHGNGEFSRSSTTKAESSQSSTAKAESTSHLPWSGPALHRGVLSHGYLEVGQIPPWPVKQSPVYHLAAIGRYGIDTPVSGPGHLQPGIGYEASSWKPLGIDDDERPDLSPEIREILRKYSPKTHGIFRKHIPASEASIAAGRRGGVALGHDDLPNCEGQSTLMSSKTTAQHESFPPYSKVASQKRGHRYEEPEGSRDSQKNSRSTLMGSEIQYPQVSAQGPSESRRLQEKFELPYVGHKRRFGNMDTGSTQQDLEKVPVTPTRQIAVAKSRLPPKG
jgi:hypothetical protein